jgi:hypothetical protein
MISAMVLLVSQHWCLADTTRPGELDDAGKVYLHAAALVLQTWKDGKITCPASSNLTTDRSSPYPDAWMQMEKADFAANSEARQLVHLAGSIEPGTWPAWQEDPNQQVVYINEIRGLSNDLTDAILYQHFQHDDAAAVESFRDQLRLAQAVERRPDHRATVLLVGWGIRFQSLDRLMAVTSQVALTQNPHNDKDLQISLARELIAQLLKHPDARTEMDQLLRQLDDAELKAIVLRSGSHWSDRMNLLCVRKNIEIDCAAMSLACHLYRFDHNAWPASLSDLNKYLPNLPHDPGGDGKQTLGYALIKGGLPDGSDRPLVYSRFGAKGALFYSKDFPLYSYETAFREGGEFRDVAWWTPALGQKLTEPPTTQPFAPAPADK